MSTFMKKERRGEGGGGGGGGQGVVGVDVPADLNEKRGHRLRPHRAFRTNKRDVPKRAPGAVLEGDNRYLVMPRKHVVHPVMRRAIGIAMRTTHAQINTIVKVNEFGSR